jgi:acyl dehydratase
VVAPPSFPAALAMNERFRHSLDLGTRLVLHGEQVLEFGRPVVAGDRLTIQSKVADVQERAGASGPMDVLILEDEARDPQGKLVFRSRATLVLRRG